MKFRYIMVSRNTQKAGFFMTEFLIYLALSAFIAVFIMRYIYGTSMALRATTLKTERIASIYAALDAVAHDLERAPSVIAHWRIVDQKELAWQQGEIRVGWKLKKDILKRYTQSFDTTEKRWKRTVSHVALEDVQEVRFLPHYIGEELCRITVSITGHIGVGNTYECKRTLLLHREVEI